MNLALLLLMVLLPVVATAADDSLVFAFFRNNGEDGLYLAASEDGLAWRPLHGNKPLLHPEVGEAKLMRDPSIARGPDGVFHMVWTTSWQGRTIGYASSKDLIQWSAQRAIPIDLGGEILNCWAPEIFYDQRIKEFRVVWASTVRDRFPETLGKGTRDYNHRQYSFRTPDFQSIGMPELFFDPGFQVIDAAVFRHGKRYGMVAKNETLQPPAKYLFVSFAPSLEGPWTKPGDSISGQEWAEGPTPVWIGRFLYVYFDKYRDHRYGVIRSKDLVHWEDLSPQLTFPAGARHGTVFRVAKAITAKLEDRR